MSQTKGLIGSGEGKGTGNEEAYKGHRNMCGRQPNAMKIGAMKLPRYNKTAPTIF